MVTDRQTNGGGKWKIGQCCCRPETAKIVKVNGWIESLFVN